MHLQKTDPNGDYIRKWLPQFKAFPKEFIFEPWKAPKAVQEVSCLLNTELSGPYE